MLWLDKCLLQLPHLLSKIFYFVILKNASSYVTLIELVVHETIFVTLAFTFGVYGWLEWYLNLWWDVMCTAWLCMCSIGCLLVTWGIGCLDWLWFLLLFEMEMVWLLVILAGLNFPIAQCYSLNFLYKKSQIFSMDWKI